MPRVFLFFAILTAQATACLWDRDTLAEEAKGRGDLVKIIVGWFDRYPPRYYEMRLERVAKELAANPNNLELLDDAAVACDRLGRPDEAIGWMEKKKAILDGLPADASSEHHYRYLANLGTFYVHRWVSKPEAERNSDLSDLRTGEKLIAKAIEENPEAHFGREVYQLNAIRWMLWDGDREKLDPNDDSEFGHDGWIRGYHLKTPTLNPNPIFDGQINGITGLIELGAAWQSLDAFHSLTRLLELSGLSSIAQLSYERERELILSDSSSLHPLEMVRQNVYPQPPSVATRQEETGKYFKVAREAAIARNNEWLAYQNTRFDSGMHPDTHPSFWKDWSEPKFPKAPGPGLFTYFHRYSGVIMISAIGLIIIILSWRFVRKRRAALSH